MQAIQNTEQLPLFPSLSVSTTLPDVLLAWDFLDSFYTTHDLVYSVRKYNQIISGLGSSFFLLVPLDVRGIGYLGDSVVLRSDVLDSYIEQNRNFFICDMSVLPTKHLIEFARELLSVKTICSYNLNDEFPLVRYIPGNIEKAIRYSAVCSMLTDEDIQLDSKDVVEKPSAFPVTGIRRIATVSGMHDIMQLAHTEAFLAGNGIKLSRYRGRCIYL